MENNREREVERPLTVEIKPADSNKYVSQVGKLSPDHLSCSRLNSAAASYCACSAVVPHSTGDGSDYFSDITGASFGSFSPEKSANVQTLSSCQCASKKLPAPLPPTRTAFSR